MALPTTTAPRDIEVGDTVSTTHEIILDFQEPVYRSIIDMTFRTVPGGRIVLQDGARVRAIFSPENFNSRSGQGTGGAANVFNKNDAVFVDQRVPRSIRKITLKSSGTAETLSLHRLDADTVADEPTVEVGPGADLPDSADEEFRDARFAIKGSPLSASDIDDILVRSYPSTPRLGLLPVPAAGQAPAIFAADAGEFRREKSLDVRDDYQAALQRSLDDQAAAGSDTIEVSLVLESDTPCEFSVPTNLTPYEIQTSSFDLPAPADASGKVVLKFEENYRQTQSVSFQVAADASVITASLVVQTDSGSSAVVDDPADLAVPTTPHGAEIPPDQWLAIPLPLSGAMLVRSLAVGLMPTVAGTVVDAEIRSDWRDTPGGPALAAIRFEPDGVQRRNWHRQEFSEPVLLSAGQAWLMLRAAQGHAVLLCDSAPDIAREGDATDARLVASGSPLARLLMDAPSTSSGTAGPLTLRIGDTEITPVAGAEPGELVFDIAAAVNAALTAAAPSPAIQELALEFVSSQPLIATVYAPELSFDR